MSLNLNEDIQQIWDYLTTANKIYFESGVPANGLGNIGDMYIDSTSTYPNTGTIAYYIYIKTATNDWTKKLGLRAANVSIQWSINGSTLWHATYAAGDLFIRFSNDDEVSWSTGVRIIGFFTYYAYASDDAGTDFNCNANLPFTFDPALEYIAQQSFTSPQTSLIAGDFAGLFTKYINSGHSFSFIPGTVEIPTDSAGSNPVYTNATSTIEIYLGDTNVTSTFSYAKGSTSNADGSLVDNVLTISSITADTGYIEVDCTKTGVSTLVARIYVKKVKGGVAGTIVTLGTDNQIPVINAAGTDFEYSVNFKWDGRTLLLKASTAGEDNMFIGEGAGANTTSGIDNIFIGKDSGSLNSISSGNVFIGDSSGKTGNYSVVLGQEAGNNMSSNGNVSVGYQSGYTMTSGGLNVFLGYQAGYSETGSDKLYIENSNSATPLIYGEFDNDLVRVNGDLDVTGDITGGGIITVANNHVISDVGNAFTDTDVENSQHLEMLNSTQIVTLAELFQGLTTYTFDGTDWVKTGNSASGSASAGQEICDLEGYDIAFYNRIGATLQTHRFDGTDWNTEGNALSVPNIASAIKIAKIGHYKIGMYHPDDGSFGGLRTYTWDGTDWTKTGNTLNLPASHANATIHSFGENSIVIVNVAGQTLQKYDWDGTDWASQGNSIALTGLTNPYSAVQLNTTDIIVRLGANVKQYRYDGYSWYLLKSVAKTVGVLCALKDGKFVSIDSVNGIQTLARINLF